jgi:hypothetical protein
MSLSLSVPEQKPPSPKTSFWEFCQAELKLFFTDNKVYLNRICDTLQDIYEGKIINKADGKPYKRLIITIPPQTGKSIIQRKFNEWVGSQVNVLNINYNELPGIENQSFLISAGPTFALSNNLISKRYKVIFIGDLIKSMSCLDPETQRKTFEFYYHGLLALKEPEGIEIILTSRWSKNDFPGIFIILDFLASKGRYLYPDIVFPNWYLSFSIEQLVGQVYDISDLLYLKNFLPDDIFRAQYCQECQGTEY